MSEQPQRLILQDSQPEFESAIRKEFIEGSAISPALFDVCIEFVTDTEIDIGGTASDPIADFLNWERKQAGFSQRQTSFASLLHNEDGSPWQAKLSYQTWDSEKNKYSKPYKAPKGNGSRAYLPPVPGSIREKIGVKYNIVFPTEGAFWNFIEAHPEIPIVVTEGGKKSLCLLSHGHVAISLYGFCSGYSKKEDGTYKLISDLERFCQPRRNFVIAFDRDENSKTVKSVAHGTSRLGSLLQGSEGQISVKVALWKASLGKGVDDLIVNQGVAAWNEAYSNAGVLPKQAVWQCLSSHNLQIGAWKDCKFPQDSRDAASMLARAKFDSSIKVIGEEGNVIKFKVFTPATDFDFSVSKMLSAADGGGTILKISQVRGVLPIAHEVYVKSIETTQVRDFINALKRELGHDVACTLRSEQLQALLQNRRAQYQRGGGEIYRLIDRIGQQEDGTWVFENAQFKPDGTPTTESQSLWVFNPQLGETEKIPSPKIAPQNSEALPNLVEACEKFFHADTLPLVWFVTGYAVATFQRKEIMEREGNFPQLSLFGDPGGGKTTAAIVAVSLVGMHPQSSIITKHSESLLYEQVKSLGGLPLLLDDPIKKGRRQAETRDQLDNFLWSAYNGATRKVRGNAQTPHTNVIVTSNIALGEGNQAVESRLIKIHFPIKTQTGTAFPMLEQAMNDASGGLSQLLAIHYNHDAVRDIRARLLEHLSKSHSRIASSLALLTYFTQRFCDVVGVNFDAFDYCVKHLCPTANNFESDKDSLSDFLEKLEQMRTEGLVGEWNVTQVKSQHKRYLAIYLPEVWTIFEQRYSPNYSRQSIEQSIVERGGKASNDAKTAKFVEKKVEWVDYERAKAAYDRGSGDEPVQPKKAKSRKAVLIPESVVQATYLSEDDIIESSFSSYATDILEDDDLIAAELTNPHASYSDDSEQKLEHSHRALISQWVRDASLTKEESRVVRKSLFGERWKQWKLYSSSDLDLLKNKIAEAGAAKKSGILSTANLNSDW
jgi:hypothetical protein